jgi:methyl-accepting chemotaxis protein
MGLIKRVAGGLGNIRMTAAISMLVFAAVIVSVVASMVAIQINLTASLQQTVMKEQQANLKAAATILASSISNAQVKWTDDGAIASITTFSMPKITDNELVDSIVRVTGQSATIFAWDKENQVFTRVSSTIVGEDGERIVGTPLDVNGPAFAAVSAGTPYFGQADIVGKLYYTAYQPISNTKGEPVGVLYVGVDKAQADAVIMDTLKLLAAVGAVILLVVGSIGWLLSRRLASPIPKLAGTMEQIADGHYDVEVPYIAKRNEVGAMARAVEVFRENGLRMAEMTEAEAAQIVRNQADRAVMMQTLQRAFGAVVDAAIAGDFSKRVDAEFPDDELNTLARSVNNLVETVDRGLGETGEVLASLANTDLTHRMVGDYQGAFATLKHDTNAVADKLTDIVGQLRETSGALKTATSEILSGANDLSERTTKQAATIEETSAAMEQLAATVMQNAERARGASDVASSVTKTAEEGGQVMNQATEAMERITQSSGKISNIIGLIDDIAFQTNLLALNASVEAARAGDAGKGFAVVAVEVRRLAQSAAKASADVKVLIEQSANEVKGGSKLVSDAASKLETMVVAARSSNELMGSIAKESREQASSIEEVNTAVRTMDEMTQHNAALVEEINAAIEQTEAQASELDRIVDIFALEERAKARPAAAAPAKAPAQFARGLQDKLKSVTRSYLSHGNAAVDKDWSEF